MPRASWAPEKASLHSGWGLHPILLHVLPAAPHPASRPPPPVLQRSAARAAPGGSPEASSAALENAGAGRHRVQPRGGIYTLYYTMWARRSRAGPSSRPPALCRYIQEEHAHGKNIETPKKGYLQQHVSVEHVLFGMTISQRDFRIKSGHNFFDCGWALFGHNQSGRPTSSLAQCPRR